MSDPVKQIIVANSYVDTTEYFLKLLDDSLKVYRFDGIAPNTTKPRVTKVHPFALIQEKKVDIFPSVCVNWSNDSAPFDFMGAMFKTEEITIAEIDNLKAKAHANVMEGLTAGTNLEAVKQEIINHQGESAPEKKKLYGEYERYDFVETLDFEIWDKSLDVKHMLYKVVKSIILSGFKDLALKGVVPMSFQGTPSGQYNFDQGFPLYGASLTLTVRNTTEFNRVTVPGSTLTMNKAVQSIDDIHPEGWTE